MSEPKVLDAEGRARHVLLVLLDGAFSTHPLPASGRVTIGRSEENDVRIDHASISRRHAVLHVGARIEVEDLESANGTLVRAAAAHRAEAHDEEETAQSPAAFRPARPRERVEIRAGNTLQLGSATLVLQRTDLGARPRRLLPHEQFEACLEGECARAERSRSPFAVLRLHIGAEVAASVVEGALLAATRSFDMVGAYGPGEYEALLVDADPATAAAVGERVVSTLADAGAEARLGTAGWPDDGRTPEALLDCASARLRNARRVPEAAAGVVVRDPAMIELYELARRVADSTISVLLLGETGSGKEVLAETMWRLSKRANKPFLRLNCAALSESLLESELFGHERGSFTGAAQPKPGLLEAAEGGTVLLDEIGELPLSVQTKLLRVLEDKQVLRVGAVKPRKIDVRFLAATNRDLEVEIARGAFRADLYYRISGVSLSIPPLRERRAEIVALADSFLARFAAENGREGRPAIRDDTAAVLAAYDWPGNIRELRNVMERALLLGGAGPITPAHLPLDKMRRRVAAAAPASGFEAPPASVRTAPPAPDSERERILGALERCAGNQTQAAKMLGISRGTFVSRLERYGVPRPRK